MSLLFPKTSNLSATDSARLTRIESALPKSVAGSVVHSNSSVSVPASSAVLANGLISPSSGISATGNTFPFVVQGKFYFFYSNPTLTIYWDNTNGSSQFVIRRADATNLTIPRGLLTISGLSPRTRYGFASFIAVAQPNSISFVPGDAGSPRFAFSPAATADAIASATRTQRLTSNESLTTGLIYFDTSAGSGPGTDSAGNDPYTGHV
jgi:hypothetical protein